MMRLFEAPFVNPNVVRGCLAEMDAEIERVSVDMQKGEHKSPEFLAKNPAGSVPVLELDDGTCLAESLAICEYLDEVLNDQRLMGATAKDRAITRMWIRRIDLRIAQPVQDAWRYGEGLEYCKTVMRVIPHASQDLKAKAKEGIAWLDEQVRDRNYVCGDQVSLADIYLLSNIEFADHYGQPIDPDLRWISGWRSRMMYHAAAREIVQPPY